ncbi:MAG: Lar family restriction alleviation protein [Armatimonadetes bacterium]|nr:Lar family restriction alleviation protein [Armatimonadota bacterium]
MSDATQEAPEPMQPCPFCGGDGFWFIREDEGLEGWVECARCKARGPKVVPYLAAVRAWNQRRTP